MAARAKENLPGGSLKYVCVYLKVRIFKCSYRILVMYIYIYMMYICIYIFIVYIFTCIYHIISLLNDISWDILEQELWRALHAPLRIRWEVHRGKRGMAAMVRKIRWGSLPGI